LLQKEGIAHSSFDQESLERHQARIVPQQSLQEYVSAGGGQRVQPQLCVVRLAAPRMLILRAGVDQEQDSPRGQALDEAVQQRLGFGVNPVQILKDQEHGLCLTFPQENALQRLERALTALRRVELEKWMVLGEDL